jgi:hypothetical protein
LAALSKGPVQGPSRYAAGHGSILPRNPKGESGKAGDSIVTSRACRTAVHGAARRCVRMKILIVSEMSVPYATGGGEVRYALLAGELVKAGHDVTWLSMQQRQSPRNEVLQGVKHLHRGPHIANPPVRPLLAKLCFICTLWLHMVFNRNVAPWRRA